MEREAVKQNRSFVPIFLARLTTCAPSPPLPLSLSVTPARVRTPVGTRPRRLGHGHRQVPTMSILHQPLRHLYRGRSAVEVLHVQLEQRGTPAV